jgi:hypothetical protein
LNVCANQRTKIAEIPSEDPDPKIPARLRERWRHAGPEEKTACRERAFDQSAPT